jgi:TonB family protein
VLAHGAVIVGAIAGPSLGPHAADDTPTKQVATEAEYVIPPDQTGPRQQEHLQFVSVGEIGSSTDVSTKGTEPVSRSSAAKNDQANLISVPKTVSDDDAYSVLDVDSAAVRDPSSAAPAYPPAMMSLSIEGMATMRFVVDTAGRVDLSTVKTLSATNAAFSNAVLVALPRMRFHPAHIGARAVRQESQEVFKFQLTHLAPEHP